MRIAKLLYPFVFAFIITFGLVGGLALTRGAIAAPDAPTATIIYVDADALGAASGASWTDAYTTVQDALTVAAAGSRVPTGPGG